MERVGGYNRFISLIFALCNPLVSYFIVQCSTKGCNPKRTKTLKGNRLPNIPPSLDWCCP